MVKPEVSLTAERKGHLIDCESSRWIPAFAGMTSPKIVLAFRIGSCYFNTTISEGSSWKASTAPPL